MGQLERYGLYVLCVVIVLILGVAIWGGDPVQANVNNELENIAQSAEDDWTQAELNSADLESTIAPPAAPPVDPFFEPTAPDAELAGFTQVDTTTIAANVPVSSATPPAAGQPPAGEPTTAPANSTRPMLRTYTVKKGDTMGAIAQRELGSIKFTKEIERLNPSVRPEKMRPGQVLRIPWVDGAPAPDPEAKAAAWREYTVKKDDTAYDISLEVYGTAKHMKAILDANKIKDPKRLKPGQTLRIPPVK